MTETVNSKEIIDKERKLSDVEEKEKIIEKETESGLTEHQTSVETSKVKSDIETQKSKEEITDLLKEKNIKNLKTIQDVEKATDRYGKIMDKYGVDTVLGWFPGGDLASGVFSTFFLLYQAGKLPKGQKMSFIDKLKIFGLQAVDTFGKPVGKIGSTVFLAAKGAILGIALGPIGAAVGGVVGGIGGYMVGGILFDYFFKANKWSAGIFKKHCDKVKKEALNQGMEKEGLNNLEKDQNKISSFLEGFKKDKKDKKESV